MRKVLQLSVKTSTEIEEVIPKLLTKLYLQGEPKWVALRFLINISLSVNHKFDFDRELLDGSEYRLEQLLGKGKESEDYSKHYRKLLESFEDRTFTTEKEFERNLEYHIERGINIIGKQTIQAKTDMYTFIIDEFGVEN